MCILFYPKNLNLIGTRLRKIMISEGCSMEIYHIFEDLSLRLHKPKQYLDLMVFMPADIDELLALLLIRDKLTDISLVLILPDQSEDMTAIGHRLFPRFISYAKSDFSDVAGVINRILSNRICAE